MACSIAIQHVNLILGTPQKLRVIGIAPGCLQVTLTTNPAVTAPVTATPAGGNGRFAFEVNLSQQFACDVNGPVVTVSCSMKANPSDTCQDMQWSGPLPCCEGNIVSVNATVPPGRLTPTHVDVSGVCFGCPSNQVSVSVDKLLPGGVTLPLITPAVAAVDSLNGAFGGHFPVIASGVVCGDDIVVTVTCTTGACTIAPFKAKLHCPQCFRAEISVAVAPCADPDDPSTTATFTIRAGLQKGEVRSFELDFGNGLAPCQFVIDNTAGGEDAVYAQTCNSTFPTGQQYTATLRASGCELPLVLSFFVDCAVCPNATVAVVVGNCVVAGPGVNLATIGSRPVTFTVDVPTGVPANLKTTANFTYGAPDLTSGRTHSGSPLPSRLGAGQLPPETIYLGPGTYYPTVALTFLQGNQLFCPPQPSLELTNRPAGQQPAVDVATCLDCPISLLVSKDQNAQLPPPHWRFTAVVNWGSAGPPNPPPVVLYDWTVTGPSGVKHAMAQTRIPMGQTAALNVITTQDGSGWHGTLATVNGGVDLSQGGSYQVSVSARFAHNSGLPLDPGTLEVSCNTTGGVEFTIPGVPPTDCQAVTGVSATPAGCADPTQAQSTSVTFTATGMNLGSGPYRWDFGDPASGTASTATTTVPTATHSFTSSGNFPVKVTILAAGACPQTEWMTGVTVSLCACPAGQTRKADGTCGPPTGPGGPEGLGCIILRWLAVALVAFGLVTALILACKWSQLSNVWQGVMLGVGIGFFVLGIILFIIWVFACPAKPCLWGWLLAGQVAFGVALACVYFLPLWPWHMACCPWVFLVSFSVFGTLAAIFLGIWIYRCMPSFCQVMIEVVPVIGNVILVAGWIFIVQEVKDCVDPLGGAIVATISAIAIFLSAGCAASGVTTKTGAPAR